MIRMGTLMTFRWTLLWLVLSLLTPGAALAEKEYPFWQLVAKSYMIVEGTLEVPTDQSRKAEQTGAHHYVAVNVLVRKVLKGPETESMTFRYYTDTELYGGVTRNQIISWNGQPVVVFLQKVRNNFYLAAYAPETIQPVEDVLHVSIRKEVADQERQIQESNSYASSHVLSKESEVQSLIELMVDKRIDPAGAAEVYYALVTLGEEAVPAIIKYMDDRRKLTIPKITLEPWWPDAHEGLVHYGPETVTDVLSVALMALTRQDLTAIYNGGTELERSEAVRIWKVYERRTYGQGS